jgi:glycerol uptake facilitator-like aquaporin
MAERLAGGNIAIALLANAIATGVGLVALILMFGTTLGTHFNPVVTLSEIWQKNVPVAEVVPYITVQIVGKFAGATAAHLMFDVPVFLASEHVRTSAAQWLSEFVASFYLIAVIIGCPRSWPSVTPFAVAAYITAAYWFTSSPSFANPAVTLAQRHRYVRRHPSCRYPRVHRRADAGHGRRDAAVLPAVSGGAPRGVGG